KSPDDDTKALPPPFAACPHHLLEVQVECGQGSESAHHEPISVPEATEDRDVFSQRIKGFRLTEGGSQLLHPTLARKRVAQGFEEPDFGAELVVDGHAGNVGRA